MKEEEEKVEKEEKVEEEERGICTERERIEVRNARLCLLYLIIIIIVFLFILIVVGTCYSY